MLERVTQDRLHVCMLARRNPMQKLLVNLFISVSIYLCAYMRACLSVCLSAVPEVKNVE